MKNVKASSNNVDRVFNVLNSCITSIHFGDDVYNKVDLTEKGVNEAVCSASLLSKQSIDLAFTSNLKRAQKT